MTSQDSDDGAGQDRVAKVLARAGVASRREVERLIEAGRVALNGKVLTTPAVKIEAGDILTVDGEVIAGAEPTRVFRYHKPAGLMTTHTDPKGRPTVFEALPPGLPRLISVGRLDLSSEGLLLLTNDGALTRALELPSSGWSRIYRARAYGEASQEKLDRLKDGITVEGIKYGPIDAKLDKASGRNVWITVTLAEGKNREVRRVLEALGLKVNRLIRLAYGPFSLGPLAPGQVEEVGPRVIRELLGDYIDPANLPTGSAVQFKPPANAPSRRDPSRPPPSQKSAAAAEKPEKPVYKPGWARAKPKLSGHVMPKAPKEKRQADFGPGKRDPKPRPFKSNAPRAVIPREEDRRSPATAPVRQGPRDSATAIQDEKARALRLALAGLDDDGPRPKGRDGAAMPRADRPGPERKGPDRKGSERKGTERKSPERRDQKPGAAYRTGPGPGAERTGDRPATSRARPAPKDLRPQHFKDRDLVAAPPKESERPPPKAKPRGAPWAGRADQRIQPMAKPAAKFAAGPKGESRGKPGGPRGGKPGRPPKRPG